MSDATVEREAFADAIAFAARSLPRSSPIPTLNGIKLHAVGNALSVSAFDYDTFTEADVTYSGPSFTALVPGAAALRYVAGMPNGTLRLTVAENAIEMACGGARVNVPRLALENYPSSPPAPPEVGTVDADLLRDAFATAREQIDPNHAIIGVRGIDVTMADTLTVAGVHPNRLAVRDLEWAATQKTEMRAVVPIVAAEAARSMSGTLSVGADDSRFALSSAGHRIVLRTIQAAPTQYPRLFDLFTGLTDVTLDREALIQALKWVVSGDSRKESLGHLQLDVGTESVRVALWGADVSADISLDAKVEGDPVLMAWKAENLLHGLTVAHGELVTLSIGAPKRSARLLAEGDPAFRYLAQPLVMSATS